MSEDLNIMVRANSVIDFKCKSWIDNCVLSPYDWNNSRNVFLGTSSDLNMGSVVWHFVRPTNSLYTSSLTGYCLPTAFKYCLKAADIMFNSDFGLCEDWAVTNKKKLAIVDDVANSSLHLFVAQYWRNIAALYVFHVDSTQFIRNHSTALSGQHSDFKWVVHRLSKHIASISCLLEFLELLVTLTSHLDDLGFLSELWLTTLPEF